MDPSEINEITRRIIKCAYQVLNELGAGFVEKVYDNALAIALRDEGLQFVRKKSHFVSYRQEIVGEFEPDYLVEGAVMVENKAVRAILPEHASKSLSYLKASGTTVGLLLNFGSPTLGVKRLVRGFQE